MIIKFIKKHTRKGVEFKKGTEIAVSREEAIELCEDGVAVAEVDLPCEDRQKKAARKKEIKRKETEKDSGVSITNK